MGATAEATRRDVLNIGRRFTDEYREAIDREIDGLRWTDEPQAPMSPGLGINAAIKELKIPRVSAYATNGVFTVPDGLETASYGVYGIEGNYTDARIRLYIADTGTELVPLMVDVFDPTPAPERTRDEIPGQVTVQLPDGREFAVVRTGRRWTRVHEYLSNGQLTARWFVDEATREVREAEGARKPKRWRMASIGASLPLWIVELSHDPTGGV